MDYSKIESVTELPIVPVGMYVIDKFEFESLTNTARIAALIVKFVNPLPSILKGQYVT